MQEESDHARLAKIIKEWTDTVPQSIEPITGGIANHVYRVSLSNNTFILKCYGTTLAQDPSVRIDNSRYEIEKTMYGITSSYDGFVRVPKLLYFNDKEYCIGLEDIGTSAVTLFDLLQSDKVNGVSWDRMVRELRLFLEWLNSRPITDTLRQYSDMVWSLVDGYYNVQFEKCVTEYQLEEKLKECRDISVSKDCLVHGDLWPTHILIDSDQIWIVDWEVSRLSFPCSDLEQLQANLWIMKNCNEQKFNVKEVERLMDCIGGDWRVCRKDSQSNFLRWITVLVPFKHWESLVSERELVLKAIKEVEPLQ